MQPSLFLIKINLLSQVFIKFYILDKNSSNISKKEEKSGSLKETKKREEAIYDTIE